MTDADPVLTLSNVIKQAVKFRTHHCLTTDDLGEVVYLMLTHGWIPNRDLLKGIPSGYFDLFRIRVVPGLTLNRPIWCNPHDDPDLAAKSAASKKPAQTPAST